MLQRDYLMKMVEMLTTVLMKVLNLKESKNYSEALKELEAAGKTIAGLDFEMVKILKAEDLVTLMKTSDVYAGRCLISAGLLSEYADIIKTQNDRQCYDYYNKSFRLYTEALLTKEIPDPEKYIEKADQLIPVLTSAGFISDDRPENYPVLFEYYYLSGKYSKAEDVLFDILESDFPETGDKGRMRKRAVTFYKDLISKDETELVNGNFSMEEARESLEEILSQIKLN
ncbi:MAG: hypothetical protein IPM38_01970 [Ignavibacteria bacterium]|nr:hypothetical protein [Ignavibacteria bacterium]